MYKRILRVAGKEYLCDFSTVTVGDIYKGMALQKENKAEELSLHIFSMLAKALGSQFDEVPVCNLNEIIDEFFYVLTHGFNVLDSPFYDEIGEIIERSRKDNGL